MSSVKNELLSGVTYIAVAKYSGIFVQLVVTSLLARLLVPEDFGIVAIATVIIAFFNILSDIGIGPAIIQNKELGKEDLSNIFSFTVYIGVTMALVFFLLSYAVAAYYGNKTLVPVCQLLAIPIVFQCANIVPLNLHYKEKRFKLISQTTLAVQVVAGAMSMMAALMGWGLYALILSQIVSACLLFVVYYWRVRLHFSFKPSFLSLKKIMSFSVYQFLFNLLNYFSRNLDKLLIGKFVGMAPLGYYEKSYRLMMMPLQNITFVINPVLQPIFSNFQNDYETLVNKYLKLLSALAYIAFPVTVAIYFLSEELILLLFGNQWVEAIPVFKILSVSIGVQILNSTTGSIFQSANATKHLFFTGCWGTVFITGSFVVTISVWGTIEAVAYGFLASLVASAIQCFYSLMKVLRHTWLDIIKLLLKPFLISAIMFAVLYLVFTNCHIENLILSLIVKLCVSLALFLITCQWIGEYKVSTILGMLKQKF